MFFLSFFGKIKVNSDDDLHNVIILIKLVFSKDQNHYYYNIFLEKFSYQLAKK